MKKNCVQKRLILLKATKWSSNEREFGKKLSVSTKKVAKYIVKAPMAGIPKKVKMLLKTSTKMLYFLKFKRCIKRLSTK